MSSNVEYPKVCILCNTPFVAKKISTQYCSHQCSKRAYKYKVKEKRVANVVQSAQETKNRKKTIKVSEKTQPFGSNSSSLIEREFLGVKEVAQLLGVTRVTVNRYCVSGKLKCIKMNRKIFIRRKDIDGIFEYAPNYVVKPRAVNTKPKNTPLIVKEVSEVGDDTIIKKFISAGEASMRYGVAKDELHNIARSHKMPFQLEQGIKHYSLTHLNRYFKNADLHSDITEWYSVDEILKKYAIPMSTFYSMIGNSIIPRKTAEGRRNLYSKSHIDDILRAKRGDDSVTDWCDAEALCDKYGIQRQYVISFSSANKIPRRRQNGSSQYSAEHFDKAIEKRNPSMVYLKLEDAANYFGISVDEIISLIKDHDIPTQNDDIDIRVQRLPLTKILQPEKL